MKITDYIWDMVWFDDVVEIYKLRFSSPYVCYTPSIKNKYNLPAKEPSKLDIN